MHFFLFLFILPSRLTYNTLPSPAHSTLRPRCLRIYPWRRFYHCRRSFYFTGYRRFPVYADRNFYQGKFEGELV